MLNLKILRIIKWAAITTCGLIVCSAILIGILIWQRPWMPFLDDGPFRGKPVELLPTTKPQQIFPVRNFILEVYSPSPDNRAPIVLLRDSDKKIKWAIYAEGYESTKVTSLEFVDYRTIFNITIRGHLKWTYGHEAMWWTIGRDGSLKEYWYSW